MSDLTAMMLIVLWTLSAIACLFIAEQKGRSGPGWAALGVLFGPITLLAIAMTSPIDDKEPYTNTTLVADELSKLASLREKGALSENEFEIQKAKLLG